MMPPVFTIDEQLLDRPVGEMSHISWIDADGEVCEELIPWEVQAAPDMLSFRAMREWYVESVLDKRMVEGTGAISVSVRFVVCRERLRRY